MKNRIQSPQLVSLQLLSRIEAIEAKLDLILNEQKLNATKIGLLTTKEAAKVLGLSVRTIQSYRDQAYLPFIQFGREVRFRQEDLQEFLNQHYNKPRFWKQEGGDQ